jgi:hypothetical protein
MRYFRSTTLRDVVRRACVLLSIAVFPLVGVAPTGCGDSTPRCVPGQSIACAGSGCNGHQVCAADGKTYGACLCGNADSAQFPGAGPNSGLIGAACSTATSCRAGLECVTADSTLIHGEGPSGGMCLARCLPDHDFCKALDAQSRCVVLYDGGTAADPSDDVAFCLPGCVLGTQPNELDKCRGRADLVCGEAAASSSTGSCRPACRSDVDCPGRACNLATGLCSDSPPAGAEIGSDCGGKAPAACSGGCIDHGGSYAECSGVCSYGKAGCGQAESEFPLKYYCYLDPATASGEGDLGYCAKVCNCDEDCERADAVCEPRPTLAPKTGRSGICGSKTYSTGTPRKNTPC